MRINEVMTKGCKYCGASDDLPTVAQLMASEDIGAVPIARDDKLVGMVTDRDIVVRGLAQGRDPRQTSAGDLMTEHVYYCYDNDECGDVSSNMNRLQVRRLPVVDTDKRLVGMVSLGDLASHGASAEAEAALEGVSQDRG